MVHLGLEDIGKSGKRLGFKLLFFANLSMCIEKILKMRYIVNIYGDYIKGNSI